MRIKLTVEYDGTNFSGWQTQPNLRTVQDELEKAITSLTGENARVTASGRTDAGVHAFGQAAHFDCAKDMGAKFVSGLNFYLPPDVRVVAAERVSDDFHSRFCAKNKTYAYVMYESNIDSAVLRNRAVRVPKLNVAAMDRAARIFLGKHDFAAFRSTGTDTATTVRTITDISVRRKDGLVIFTVSADGFLYNMVRKMAAALIDVGRRKRGEDAIASLLDEGAVFAPVAPPQGLYLMKVEYK